MHRVFQQFIDHLAAAESPEDFSRALADAAAALDLPCFAYLGLWSRSQDSPRLISTYPSRWTTHYLRSNYQSIDPVLISATHSPEPFCWGVDLPSQSLSIAQKQLFDEASQSGIRFGFTVPVHRGRRAIAALTFATDERRATFESSVNSQGRVLQLMSLLFHTQVQMKLATTATANGIRLSRREHQCLEWAARGKSAWEIGRILGISQHTAASYLNNVKKKLGVRTLVQAAIRMAADKKEEQNFDEYYL